MFPIRPINPAEVNQEITMVAKNQSEYQTLPSIFLKEGNVCVSRWALEDKPFDGQEFSERELLKEYKTLWLYQLSNKSSDELCGHFLSSRFISEESLSAEMRYSNRVFYNAEAGGSRIIFPIKSEVQENSWLYRWDLSENQVTEALDNNSVFIYQFNLRKPITPLLVSLYHGLMLQ